MYYRIDYGPYWADIAAATAAASGDSYINGERQRRGGLLRGLLLPASSLDCAVVADLLEHLSRLTRHKGRKSCLDRCCVF